VTVTEQGGFLIPPGVSLREFTQARERSYRFGRVRRVLRRSWYQAGPGSQRRRLAHARSLAARARHGIGPHDTWSLHEYLCRVTARGFALLADTLDPHAQAADTLTQQRHEHAAALRRWSGDENTGPPDHPLVQRRQAQAALRWLAHHLDTLPPPDLPPHLPLLSRLCAVLERARHGIARTDLPHLTRHLSDLADRGLTDLADLGWSYPSAATTHTTGTPNSTAPPMTYAALSTPHTPPGTPPSTATATPPPPNTPGAGSPTTSTTSGTNTRPPPGSSGCGELWGQR
jgi:hypothetical protein